MDHNIKITKKGNVRITVTPDQLGLIAAFFGHTYGEPSASIFHDIMDNGPELAKDVWRKTSSDLEEYTTVPTFPLQEWLDEV